MAIDVNLLAAFEALETLPPGLWIRESLWLFPAIEAVHLLALALLGGTVLLVDLRLLGVLLRDRPVAALAADAGPWLRGAVAGLLVSGALLFSSEAVKCYWNDAFRLKMAGLAVAIVLTFAVREPLARRATAAAPAPALQRAVAVLSIGTWLVVAAAGRWIGFS